MKAITLMHSDMENPLAGVRVLERDEPVAPEEWISVNVKAASLNHHDVWNMRGVGVDPSWLPCVLGSDGAGIDADGNEVIIHPLIADSARGRGDASRSDRIPVRRSKRHNRRVSRLRQIPISRRAAVHGGRQFSLEPPDQGLCTGNGVVMEIINEVMRVYTPSGTPTKPVEDLNTFFPPDERFN